MRMHFFVLIMLFLATPAFAEDDPLGDFANAPAPVAEEAVPAADPAPKRTPESASAAKPAKTAKSKSPFGTGGDSKQPIDISADNSLEWDQNARTYTARGNAIAKRGDFTIYGDTLVAEERDRTDSKGTEIWKMSAEGNVRLTNGQDGKTSEAFGDRGVYDIDRQVAVLTGDDLKLVTGNDTITATERFEYWSAEKLAVAVGNAEVVRSDPAKGKNGERRIKADKMTALFKEDAQGELQAERMEAEGNVIIITATDVAKGDKGIYDMSRNKALLSGNVHLTRGKSQLAGDKAEVDFNTGISKLLDTNTGDGKRVRGLLYPKEKK